MEHKITSHYFTKIDEQTGTAYGTIHLVPLAESKGIIQVIAYNPVSIDGNAPLGQIAKKDIEMNIYYNTQNFTLDMSSDGKYSDFDKDAKILTVGDGETVTFFVSCVNENASPLINGIEFNKSPNYTAEKIKKYGTGDISTLTMIGKNNTPINQSGTNQAGFKIQFSKDFNITNGFYKADNNYEADILTNQYNWTKNILRFIQKASCLTRFQFTLTSGTVHITTNNQSGEK